MLHFSMGGLLCGMSLLLASFAAAAQDPVVAFPDNYKRLLNNADVSVIRAHYGPHEKVGVHDHSAYSTVYVYLNDSGPVRFTHGEEARPFTVDRPPTHMGAFRVSPGRRERHTVENLSDTPSDYVRVELKKFPIRTIKDEFRAPAAAQPLLSGTSPVYENPALRIERVLCDPGATCTLLPENSPSVLIAVTPTLLVGRSKGEILTFDQPCSWLPAGEREGARSMGSTPSQLLRIVLLRH